MQIKSNNPIWIYSHNINEILTDNLATHFQHMYYAVKDVEVDIIESQKSI